MLAYLALVAGKTSSWF